MIALNITDLPFYIIYILFESKIILLNENAAIFIVLSSIFKITSHSINIIIYLLRKEFRFICIEIFRNVCEFDFCYIYIIHGILISIPLLKDYKQDSESY
jgi:hypothetical protein